MICLYKKPFLKDLAKVPKRHRTQIESPVFEEIPELENVFPTLDIKKIKGYQSYYRIRVGDYRIGCKTKEGRQAGRQEDRTTLRVHVALSPLCRARAIGPRQCRYCHLWPTLNIPRVRKHNLGTPPFCNTGLSQFPVDPISSSPAPSATPQVDEQIIAAFQRPVLGSTWPSREMSASQPDSTTPLLNVQRFPEKHSSPQTAEVGLIGPAGNGSSVAFLVN